jgi:hypothetical protein
MKRALLLACVLGLGATGAPSPLRADPGTSVEGFGKDVPLGLAVRQIVPQGYSVTYGAGIDRNRRISWQGGADWQTVLRSVAVGGHHMAVSVSGQEVVLSDADAAYDGPPPASRAPGAAAASAPRQEAQRGLVLVPLRQPETPPLPAASPAPPTVVTTPVRAPVAPPSVAAAPAPVPAPAQPAAAQPAAAPPAQPVAAVPQATVPASEASAPAPSQQRPLTARERRAAAASAAAAARVAGPVPGQRASAASSVSADGRMWHARQGQTLDQVLGDWADKAGWTLVFRSAMIYELQASADFEGDFLEASGSLIRSVRAMPQPVATFYRGNRTLVVGNRADQEN